MADATGEAKEPPLRVTFDRRIKLEFHGARITSDAGLLAAILRRIDPWTEVQQLFPAEISRRTCQQVDVGSSEEHSLSFRPSPSGEYRSRGN
jgi:hypothetical protein